MASLTVIEFENGQFEESKVSWAAPDLKAIVHEKVRAMKNFMEGFKIHAMSVRIDHEGAQYKIVLRG